MPPRSGGQRLFIQPDFLEPQAVALAVVVRGVVPDIGLPAIGARTPPKTFLLFYRAAAGQAQCCANAALPSADGSLTLPFNLAWWWQATPANKKPWEEIVMTTRRDFLKAGTAAVTTGIVFCSCGLLQSAHAQQPVRQKLPVSVGGKRVKTIDVHAHCHFREAGALLGADAAAAQLPPVNNAVEAFIEIDKRLAAMDAQAIDLEVLSINPYWYNRERDLAAEIVKIQNEKLAELCASKPDRFAAFASLTLQAPDLAVQE